MLFAADQTQNAHGQSNDEDCDTRAERSRNASPALSSDADADNKRVIEELRKRKVEVIPLPFDGPIGCGGGLRCAHHPLVRESDLP